MKRVRLKDIAVQSGYSLSTVAKVLSGTAKASRICENTASKINEVAERLGYIPNLMARKLRKNTSGLIGIYLASATDSIIAATLTAILQELPSKGYSPLLTVEESGYETCHTTWIQNRVEGLLLCGPTRILLQDVFSELKRNNIPIVIAGNPYKSTGDTFITDEIPTVQINNRLGIRMAIDHLAGLGRKRIAFISGPFWHSDADERRSAYEEIITQLHNPLTVDIGDVELFWKRGYLSAQQLLTHDPSIDSIIAYDDNVALGAMKYIADNNLKIPNDIAVVGFDNQPQAEYSIPSLTSIDQPADEIGRKSVLLLEHLISHEEVTEKHISIDPSLIIRTSTAGDTGDQ